MTKSTARKNAITITTSRVFPIVLKTIINDAMNEKTITNDDDKKIRAKIRANKNAIETTQHIKNTSHVARNQIEYDALRCAFDNAYAQRLNDAIENAKRERANARKARTTSRVDDNANVDV